MRPRREGWRCSRVRALTRARHSPRRSGKLWASLVCFHRRSTHIGQATNAMLYPGLVLGAIVSRSRLISTSMLAAAANVLSSLVAVRLPDASLLPHMDNLRSVALTVAVAVGGGGGRGSSDCQTSGHRATSGRRDLAARVSEDSRLLTSRGEAS